jgi:arylsulfatase A-like enzyme
VARAAEGDPAPGSGRLVGTIARGVLAGVGYGLAVACTEMWLMVARLVQMGLPAMSPPPWVAALQLALGAFAGGLVSPLLRLPLGWLWHLAAVAALWLAVGTATAVEGDFFFALTLGPPLGGLVLALAGVGLGRWRRWLPGVAGVLILLAAFGFSDLRRSRQAASLPGVAARPPARAGAPDVVIVVLDTVRAANVSAYGYERETTPHFDALARDGALFLDATSPSNWSLPSHASLFTGVFPSVHGAHQEHRHLSADLPTLGEMLMAAGYETACFTANPWISNALGTARGFERSDEAWRTGGAGRSMVSVFRLLDALGFGADDKGGAEVASHFDDWVTQRPEDAPPFFAFLNFIEAHFPYHQIPESFLRRYSSLDRQERRRLSLQLLADQFGSSDLDRSAAAGPTRDLYDGGIHYADHLLGRVADALRRRGTLDSTVMVVLSDHGEAVGEHDVFGHGRSLYEADTRVPLLVRYPPAVAAARVPMPVSTVGVMATVLELAQAPVPPGLQVGSLLPALEGRVVGAPILAERFTLPDRARADANPFLSGDNRLRAYREGGLKLMETSAGQRFLFDLGRDPGETLDLAGAQPERLARVQDDLAIWSRALGLPAVNAPLAAAGEVPELDPVAREHLQALGYVE